MKLNNDCVRDLMLFIEKNFELSDEKSIEEIKIKNYVFNGRILRLKQALFFQTIHGILLPFPLIQAAIRLEYILMEQFLNMW